MTYTKCLSISARCFIVFAGLAAIAISLVIDEDSKCVREEQEKFFFLSKLLLMPLAYEGLRRTSRKIVKNYFSTDREREAIEEEDKQSDLEYNAITDGVMQTVKNRP